MGATIADVAARAGVSPMTVSRVVNADKNVSDTTRGRVLCAVRELNYAPNLAARSLARAEQVRIGCLYGNPSAAYLSEFLVGLLDESAGAHAPLLLVKCDGEDAASKRAAVAQLLENQVTGVVLPSPFGESRTVCASLAAAGVRAVAVATGRPQETLSCVRIDDRAASAEMTRHLLRLGHRRIGFIKGHPNVAASAARLEGFRSEVRATPDAKAKVVQGFFTFDSGLSAAEQLLDAQERPTAIFASNDDMAAAAVSVAHRRGLEVPGDVTVVGFDDTAVATTLWPPLTTVRQPTSAMAAAAMTLLLREIRAERDGESPHPVDQMVPYTLVERQSSASPRPAEVA
jgi:LacI family transcriptional regulator